MGHKRMSLPRTCLLAAFLLAGCASSPGPKIPEGDAAVLQNRAQEYGRARFEILFENINGEWIREKFWSLDMPYERSESIAPGPAVVGLKVTYIPAYSQNIFARGNDRLHYVYVRDMGATEAQIDLLSENTGVDRDSLTGLRGLRFEAEAGKTYVGGARIEDGRAWIWIEDTEGNVVSDTVVGFADADCRMQTVMQRGMYDCRPEPGHGWYVLEDLPEPR